MTIIDAGMRPEEVCRSKWETTHLQPTGEVRYGHVFNPYGKTKCARRTIPLIARLKDLLEMRQEGQGKPKEGWVGYFLHLRSLGRVESVKSQLTRLGESGAEAFTIQKIAGHSSAVISQRCVHPTPALIILAV